MKRSAKNERAETELAQENITKGSYVIAIKSCQYSTWQGNLTWTHTGESKSFRSALEMVKLIDSTLDTVDL